MDNYYDILQCKPNANLDEIKKNYQRLILETHPDKNSKGSTSRFHEIDAAWKTLRDPVERRIYDARLCQIQFDEKHNVFATLTAEEFSTHSDKLLKYSCRCGGAYMLEAFPPEEDIFEIECSECSLVVIVRNIKTS